MVCWSSRRRSTREPPVPWSIASSIRASCAPPTSLPRPWHPWRRGGRPPSSRCHARWCVGFDTASTLRPNWRDRSAASSELPCCLRSGPRCGGRTTRAEPGHRDGLLGSMPSPRFRRVRCSSTTWSPRVARCWQQRAASGRAHWPVSRQRQQVRCSADATTALIDAAGGDGGGKRCSGGGVQLYRPDRLSPGPAASCVENRFVTSRLPAAASNPQPDQEATE